MFIPSFFWSASAADMPSLGQNRKARATSRRWRFSPSPWRTIVLSLKDKSKLAKVWERMDRTACLEYKKVDGD